MTHGSGCHSLPGQSEHERRELAEQVADALTNAQLRLVSIRQAEDMEDAERLVRGEALFVELGTP